MKHLSPLAQLLHLLEGVTNAIALVKEALSDLIRKQYQQCSNTYLHEVNILKYSTK